jgi:hypothetical protein
MASVREFERGGRTVWEVRWREGGKRHSRTFYSARVAEVLIGRLEWAVDEARIRAAAETAGGAAYSDTVRALATRRVPNDVPVDKDAPPLAGVVDLGEAGADVSSQREKALDRLRAGSEPYELFRREWRGFSRVLVTFSSASSARGVEGCSRPRA